MKNLVTALFLLLMVAANGQEVAYTLDEPHLIAEGITYDTVTQTLYVSSLFKNKIVQYKDGKLTNFIEPNYKGFMGGVGLHIDYEHSRLWACFGNMLGNKSQTGVVAFDLNTGESLKQFTLHEDTAALFFNDVVTNKKGDAYFTNSLNASVWQWKQGAFFPIPIINDEALKWANGLTFSGDQKYLYIATAKGLVALHTEDKTLTPVALPNESLSVGGMDGIAWHNNAIYGVQNGVKDPADVKLLYCKLAADGMRITQVKVIDRAHPKFHIPTTLCLTQDKVLVLANSQLDNLDQPNIKLVDSTLTTPTYILSYPLK